MTPKSFLEKVGDLSKMILEHLVGSLKFLGLRVQQGDTREEERGFYAQPLNKTEKDEFGQIY